MKNSRNRAPLKVYNFVEKDALTIAKKIGMKETVHLIEAALIYLAVQDEGSYSAAARVLKVPITTLSTRKDVLQGLVMKIAKLKIG